jgi:hypothetical protein
VLLFVVEFLHLWLTGNKIPVNKTKEIQIIEIIQNTSGEWGDLQRSW